MLRMKESTIEKQTVDLAWKYLGIIGSKFVTPGNTGYPDRIFWIPGGYPLLIEFKQLGEKPRAKQKYIHTQLKQLGYRIEVHDNAIQAFSAIIRAVETTRLSNKSRQVLARARSICTILRSRSRKD